MRIGDRIRPTKGLRKPIRRTTPQPARVLVVDGVPDGRPVLGSTLESAVYIVAEANDEATALECLRQSPADLILVDLRQRDGAGLDILAALRLAGHETPAVIVSGRGRPIDVVAALGLGVIDFLFAPADPTALKALVAEVIRRHNQRRSAPSKFSEPTAVRISGLFDESMNRAKRAINQRDFQRSEQLLRQAVALEKGSAAAHGLLGVIYESRGEWCEAERCYEAAYRADPGQELARLNMLRAYNRE